MVGWRGSKRGEGKTLGDGRGWGMNVISLARQERAEEGTKERRKLRRTERAEYNERERVSQSPLHDPTESH